LFWCCPVSQRRYFFCENRGESKLARSALSRQSKPHSSFTRTHPDKGFASSLAELGPSPGAELIDAVLASGRKSGYLFILSTAPPDFSGRIMHYAVVARPQQYRSGRRNFFMDESGVERFTTEDRPATINDPPRTLE
jgi:hypothetical protein